MMRQPFVEDNSRLERRVRAHSISQGQGQSHCTTGQPATPSLLQDASEYFQYLLDIMTKAERISGHRSSELTTASAFEFGIETRVQCSESGRVSYKHDGPTNILSINIPVEAADNQEEVDLYKVLPSCPGSASTPCQVLIQASGR